MSNDEPGINNNDEPDADGSTNWLGELARRRVYQALAIYVALAWGFTEIFTTVSATFGWPEWTRDAVVILFVLGFPAVVWLAWLFDIGSGGVRRARPDSRTGIVFIASAVLAIVSVTAFLVPRVGAKREAALPEPPTAMTQVQWATEVAAPEIERLLAANQLVEAFELAREALAVLPNESYIQTLFAEASSPVNVTSEPLGASVYVKPYDAPDADWVEVGTTPFAGVPAIELRWRFEKEGYATREVGRHPFRREVNVTLFREAGQPPGMVYVDGGAATVFDESLSQGREHDIADFWIDQYEITNADYRDFLASPDYADDALWKPLINELGLEVSPAELRASLVDSTGQPGPAVWSLSKFADGDDEKPVRGISWIEAAAYCAFRDKLLPTVFHYAKAGEQETLPTRVFAGELVASNFGLDGPHPVTMSTALGPYGTYDLMGNVTEWAWNVDYRDLRYLSGASYAGPEYLFTAVGDQADPLVRSMLAGARCMRTDEDGNLARLQARIDIERPIGREDLAPVESGVYEVLRRQYEYDALPLNPVPKGEPQGNADWRVEVVTIDTAYGERMDVHVFLPNNSKPPYQTVVFFPHSGARLKPTVGSSGESSWLYFLPLSGRALVVPTYSGMYGRMFDRDRPYPDHQSRAKVQLVIHWAQDLMRAIDYLETREDIDVSRLAYYGFSLGGTYAPIFTALEERFSASVLISGGTTYRLPDEHRPANFAPQVSVPTLMIAGRNDPQAPVETYQRPILELLGTPAEDKKMYVFEGGHAPTDWNATVREVLAWLDRYLGPVE